MARLTGLSFANERKHYVSCQSFILFISMPLWYVQVPLAASIMFIHFQSVPPLSDWVGLAIIFTALLHQDGCVDEWTGLPAIQKKSCCVAAWHISQQKWNIKCSLRMIQLAQSSAGLGGFIMHTQWLPAGLCFFGRGPCIPLHFHYPLEGASQPMSLSCVACVPNSICNIPGAAW